MNSEIKKITHEDEVFMYDKLFKIITVEFNDLNKTEVQYAELMNIEIVRDIEHEYNEDGSLDIVDSFFPIRLGRAMYNRSPFALKLRFNMGQTLFNDGAMLLMVVKHDDKQEPETLVFRLKENQWIYIDGCDKIDYNDVSQIKYKLVDTDWIELGDNNG